jgi:hypothetical protein
MIDYMHLGQGVEEFAANISKMAILWLRCAFFENRWDNLWRRISLPEALATP